MIDQRTFKRAALVLLFFQLSFVRAQVYYDFGGFDYPVILAYDSINDGFTSICFSSPSFAWSLDPALKGYVVKIDKSLGLTDSISLKTKDVAPFFYYNAVAIEGLDNMVFAWRHNIQKPGILFYQKGEPSFLSNTDFCGFQGDSLRNCLPLLPDSAYSSSIAEPYLARQGDTLHIFTSWLTGFNDTTLEQYWIKLDLQTRQKTVKQITLNYGDNRFILSGGYPPIRLDNGDWLAMATHFYGNSVSGGASLIRIAPNWDSVKSWTGHKFFLPTATKFWKVNGKIVLSTTGDFVAYAGYNAATGVKAPLSLLVYDLGLDSITEAYNFGILTSNNQFQHHEAVAARFDGEHFILAGERYPRWLSDQNGMVLFEVDTTFSQVQAMLIEDSLGDDFLGSITALAKDPRSGDYYYAGFLGNLNLTGSPWFFTDLMFGKLDLQYVGLKDRAIIRKQQTWLYPNPSDGRFTLKNTAANFGPYSYKILDATGREVFRATAHTAREEVVVNLPAGEYFLQTEGGELLPLVIR